MTDSGFFGVIYQIRNLVNGRIYVGQTHDFKTRRINHLSSLRHGNHVNPILQQSFSKHGEAAFEFTILEEVSSDTLEGLKRALEVRESCWIAEFDSVNTGYNICQSSCSRLGTKLTEEQKKRIQKASTGRKHSLETLKLLSHLARNRTEEHKRKLRESKNYISLETRQKISKAHKGRVRSAEHAYRLSVAHKARHQRLKEQECLKYTKSQAAI